MPIDVSRSLFIKNDAGEFVPVPMLKGEPGPKGDPGSDANVTFENITNALGYIPADDEYVQEQAQEINQIKNTLPEVFVAEYGVSTYEEIKAAIDAGKQVYCYNAEDNVTFALRGENSTFATFSGILSLNIICNLRIRKTDSFWSRVTYSLSASVNPTRDWTFPSDKAVADYVDNVLADPSTVPVKSVSAGGAAITPDAEGNVDVPVVNAVRLADDGKIKVVTPPASTKWTGNIGIGTDGSLILATATQAIVNNRTIGTATTTGSSQFIPVGQMDYAIKALLTDGKGAAWSDAEKASARERIGASNFSGSYNDLTNKPTIPTNTNQLTNGAGYVKPSDGYEGWRVKGGINSIINNTNAVSINPAINGVGYCRFRYNADFHLFLNGVEAYLTDSTWDRLFDGKSSSYIRFNVDLTNDSRNAWDSSKMYVIGSIVYKRNSANDVRWYRAIVENINHAPIDEQTDTYWEYLENSSTAVAYKNSLDFVKYGITITLDLDFGTSVAWENGVSLYWRGASQNATSVKLYKWNYSTNDWHETTIVGEYSANDIVNTLYLGSIPSVAPTNAIMSRIKLDITPFSPTWCALTQLAITGLAGGIEGTVLSRGGDAVCGTIYPYEDNLLDMGASSKQFHSVYTRALRIGNTTLDEAKLKKLLALIQ